MPSPRYWREVPGRYRLEAGRCEDCGKVSFPARTICPSCRGTNIASITLSRRATVVTSTVVRVPPDEFLMEAPYAVALLDTPEGARFMAQVVDCEPEEVVPGMEVELEFRLIRKEGDTGIRCYGHKGVPARTQP